MSFVAIIALQAAAAWTMPAQAHWDGDAPRIAVRVEAGAVSMRGTAPIVVTVSAPDGGVAVSRFISVTRGIALDIRSLDGASVTPLEPIIGSPPPPPLGIAELTPVTATTPFRVSTAEQARNLFPGPGTYQVRAIVALFDPVAEPGRHARARSEPVTVRVTD